MKSIQFFRIPLVLCYLILSRSSSLHSAQNSCATPPHSLTIHPSSTLGTTFPLTGDNCTLSLGQHPRLRRTRSLSPCDNFPASPKQGPAFQGTTFFFAKGNFPPLLGQFPSFPPTAFLLPWDFAYLSCEDSSCHFARMFRYIRR